MTPRPILRWVVPLMEAIPFWLHGMVVLAVILYGLAAAATWRRHSMGAVFWCLASVAEQLASFAARPIVPPGPGAERRVCSFGELVRSPTRFQRHPSRH